MTKPLKITLGAVGAVFILVLIAPWIITLNQYKAVIQNEAKKATGRDILINGDIRLGLLPSPYARLTDIVVTNPQGAKSQNFATIKSVDVGVALTPLFSKKVQVTHITISEPAITMEVMANGQNNWQFTPQDKQIDPNAPQETKSASSGNALSIDDFSIEKGFVRYVDVQKQSQQTIGPIDGKFEITSLQGPITGRGTITFMEKIPVSFDTTIASLPTDENKDLPFKLSLQLLGNMAEATIDGKLQTGDAMNARVDTTVAIPDLAALLAAISKDNKSPALPAYLKGKTSFTGLMEYQNNQATINNLMIKAGSLEVLGKLVADMQDKTTVTLDLSRVALPPEAANASATDTKGKAAQAQNSAQNLAETLSSAFASATGFLDTTLPASPVNFVMTAAQLPLPGQPTLRDVRIAASLDAKGATIQNIETKLPGNTLVQIQGSLPARADGKIDHAVINTKLSTQNMQAALGQTEVGENSPLNLQAAINLSREALRVQPLQITQNGQTVQADVVYNPKAKDALNVAVKGSALNLDSFLGTSEKASSAKASAKTAKAIEAPEADPLAKLQGLKARVTAELGSVTYQSKTAKNVTMAANVSSSGLHIEQARIGDLGGMVIDAKGKIDRLSPLSGANITASANTPNLSQTMKALGNDAAENLGASQFSASINGDANKLAVALNGSIDQGKIALNGTASQLNTSPSFTGNIDVNHPETATILRNFAGMKPAVALGPFVMKANIAYGTNMLKADGLTVKMGNAGTLQGHVNVTPEGNGRKIDADIRADKLALAAMMGDDVQTSKAQVDVSKPSASNEGWSREAINLESLRGLNGKANVEIGELLYKKFVINNFKSTMVFGNNTITLQQLKGNLFDAGAFSINGQFAPGAANQAHRGDISITVDKTDAPKLFVALGSKPFNKGTLDMNLKANFSGASPYALVSSLNGDGQFKVTDGIVNGIDLDGLAAKLDRPNSLTDFAAIINQARAGGETKIGDVTIPITIRSGVAQVQDTTIKTEKTAMEMKGTVNLPVKTVDMLGQISFVEQRNLPPLTLFIKGPMNDPQKSFDTRAFTQFYAQKATEKLQEKAKDKLGKLLGIETPAATTPAAPVTTPVAPTTPATDSVTPTTTAPATTAPAAPAKTEKQQRDEAIKQLGGQMLNNLFGGGAK